MRLSGCRIVLIAIVIITVGLCAISIVCIRRINSGKQQNQVKELQAIWTEGAKNAMLPDEAVELVARLISEALSYGSGSKLEVDHDRLSQSLDRFLRQFESRFHRPNHSRGYCYWTAWLLAESARRPPRTPQEIQAARISFETFRNDLVSLLNTRLREENGEEKYQKYSEYINECLTWTKETLDKHFVELHDDPMFPALHSPITQEAKEWVLAEFAKEPTLPRVSKPTKMMVLEDEIFHKDLKRFFKDVPERVVWGITFRTISKRLNKTKYWGYMKYRTWSCGDGVWPIDAQFVPNRDLNKAKRWVRDENKNE